ncbi:hypothetical protein D3C75_1298000 [compost metagenome]
MQYVSARIYIERDRICVDLWVKNSSGSGRYIFGGNCTYPAVWKVVNAKTAVLPILQCGRAE